MRIFSIFRERWERGVAMLELAIVAPLLFVLCSGTIDITRMLLTHIALTQIVREGARLASGEQGMENGPFLMYYNTAVAGICRDYHISPLPSPMPTTPGSGPTCNACIKTIVSPSTPYSIQPCVLNQLYQVIQKSSNQFYIDMPSLIIKGEYVFAQKMVRYDIYATYNGFFRPFDGQQISVSATGPYL